MTEKLLLRSQTSIAYLATVILFFIIAAALFFSLIRRDDWILVTIAIAAAVAYLAYFLDFVLNLRCVRFYETYFTIRYVFTKREFIIKYAELSTFQHEHGHYQSKVVYSMQSENDMIALTVENGKKITFGEMYFDNFSSMRVFLQKVIRGEPLD